MGRKKKSKLKNYLFKEGNKFSAGPRVEQAKDTERVELNESRIWKRYTADFFEDLVQQDNTDERIITTDSNGVETDVKILRPLPANKPVTTQFAEMNQGPFSEVQTNRLLNLLKTQILWNEAIMEHFPPPPCGGQLIWDMKGEIQRGFAWRERLSCTCGKYTSSRHNLYSEKSSQTGRGPKEAAINTGIQIGLTHTSIGPSSLRQILLAGNIPPPSTSGMQVRANATADALVELNEDDMAEQRHHLQNINEARGLPRDAPIRAEGDGRYNNPLRSGGGKTPFQPGTQSTYAISENSTKNKKIVTLNTENKLCCKGQKGGDHSVHVCTKSLRTQDLIGDEEKSASKAYKKMLETTPIRISHFTSDGDSKAVKGIQSVEPEHPVESMKDTQHLSGSIYRSLTNGIFSDMMIPTRTCALKKRAQRELAHSLKRRLNAEFKAAHKLLKGDLPSLNSHLKRCTTAIISCFGGECGRTCRKYSLVCNQGKRVGRWDHSTYTQFLRSNNLLMTASDVRLLKTVINKKLGPEAVYQQRFNTNTQKSEAINRTFSRTNPKNKTFSRNFSARIHSAVHLRNHGIGESTLLKCDSLDAPITVGSKVAKALDSEQKKELQIQNYHKGFQAKKQRQRVRKRKYRLYNRAHAEDRVYEKDMLERGK